MNSKYISVKYKLLEVRPMLSLCLTIFKVHIFACLLVIDVFQLYDKGTLKRLWHLSPCLILEVLRDQSLQLGFLWHLQTIQCDLLKLSNLKNICIIEELLSHTNYYSSVIGWQKSIKVLLACYYFNHFQYY